MPKQTREQTVLAEFPALVGNYSRNPDPAIWANLVDYARKAQALFVELKDEDYVRREAANLLDVALLGQHKFGPRTLANLVDTYGGFSNPGRRMEALSSHEGIELNQNSQEIAVVINFLTEARVISNRSGDPDWLLRKIEDLLGMASRRLSALDPIAEGVYDIVFVPAANAPVHCLDPNLFFGVFPDRLFLANSMTSDGIVAEFMGGGSNFAFFKNLVFTGDLAAVRSSSISTGIASVFSMRLQKESGIVEGLFRSTRYACTYKFEGRRLRSPGRFLRDGALAQLPAASALPGIYSAVVTNPETGNTITGSFVLREYKQIGGLTLAGSYFHGNAIQDFQYGYFVEPRGFMVLNATRGENTLVRWHLAWRPDASGEWAWRGFMMSFFNGRVSDVVMRRTGDLGDVDDGLIHP